MYVNINLPLEKCKLIAEIGLTHEGSLGFAFKFIESAKLAGADMVKFQFHLPEAESSKVEQFRVKFSLQDKTRWEYWQRTSFSISEWEKIIEKCNEELIEFCVSVFSGAAANKMISLGVKNIKLGSGDLTNGEIHEKLVNWSGNLFLSTGLATHEEIDSTINFFQNYFSHNQLTVFQCTSKYPTSLDEVGINVMEEIRAKWKVKSGLSDHTDGIDSAKVAICFGANAIEKHVVFSKEMFGPDVSSSITFNELRQLSSFRDNFLRIMEKVDKNKIAKGLENERKLFGRSLGLNREFQKGEILKEDDFCLRKPAGGLAWHDRHSLIGKKLRRDVELGELLQLEYFD